MHHLRTSTYIFPLVFITVAGPVWYATSNHASLSPVAQMNNDSGAIPSIANTQPVPTVSPQIQKSGKQVILNLNTAGYTQVHKVEFYVENHFIGAGYNSPYTVRVDASTISGGTHQIVAKIYTDESTIQSQPVAFVSSSLDAVLSPDVAESNSISTPTVPATTNQSTETGKSLSPPNDVTIVASGEGTSATLNWNGGAESTSYQLWRDGSQIASTAANTFTDTALSPGTTYDYQVVAVNTAGQASDFSNIAAVTMPIPQTNNTAVEPNYISAPVDTDTSDK